MPCLRDAMAVIDEDNLNAGGSATAKVAAVAPTPSITAGSAISLAPGPMELGAISAAQRNSGQCARCKGYGHWSPVCPPPRNWKWGDPVAGKPVTSSGPSGSSLRTSGGGSVPARAKVRAAKGSQTFNTEVDQDSDQSTIEEEDTLEDEGAAESESGNV